MEASAALKRLSVIEVMLMSGLHRHQDLDGPAPWFLLTFTALMVNSRFPPGINSLRAGRNFR